MMTPNADIAVSPADPLDAIPPSIWQALAAGWLPGPPDDLPDDALAVDRYTAAAICCEHCGEPGGKYRAVHNTEPAAYRAFSCCRECGYATEL